MTTQQSEPDFQGLVAGFLKDAFAAEAVRVQRMERLGGGAIQENYALDVAVEGGAFDGAQALVLRTDAPSGVAVSLGRAQEYAVLRAAFEAGVRVPEPLCLRRDDGALGRDFYVMRRIAGSASGPALVRGDLDEAARAALLEDLGAEIARLHEVTPPAAGLDFLPLPRPNPPLHRVAQYRGYLDGIGVANPSLEWALRWLERNAPRHTETVLCHGDYRTGNFLVQDGRLTGILDWEFAGWSDPLEDLGWFCAPCWRFGAREREAGGIGSVEPLLRGYERISGRRVPRDQLPYWEIMAGVRWGVIALMQAHRHISGEERSLELALTGRLVPEMEMDVLGQIAEIEREGG